MRWFLANLALAVAVSGYVTWGIHDLRHSEACVYSALTIIDGANHHIAAPLLDSMRRAFDETC